MISPHCGEIRQCPLKVGEHVVGCGELGGVERGVAAASLRRWERVRQWGLAAGAQPRCRSTASRGGATVLVSNHTGTAATPAVRAQQVRCCPLSSTTGRIARRRT